jgi:hypothetical protein
LVDGFNAPSDTPCRYWLSVQGKVLGPYPPERILVALARRQLNADTPACAEGSQQWQPLRLTAGFDSFLSGSSRDSRAHLGVGSSHLDLTAEEAELHLAGKAGDMIARLISTLLDLRRRYRDNPSMVEIIDKNIGDLKALRDRGLTREMALPTTIPE